MEIDLFRGDQIIILTDHANTGLRKGMILNVIKMHEGIFGEHFVQVRSPNHNRVNLVTTDIGKVWDIHWMQLRGNTVKNIEVNYNSKLNELRAWLK